MKCTNDVLLLFFTLIKVHQLFFYKLILISLEMQMKKINFIFDDFVDRVITSILINRILMKYNHKILYVGEDIISSIALSICCIGYILGCSIGKFDTGAHILEHQCSSGEDIQH